MPADLRQLLTDVSAINERVQQITGLPSRWSGSIDFSDSVNAENQPAFSAKKEWDCRITLHTSIVETPDRFETLVHEVFHAVSADLTPLSFLKWRGYEEGVVEKLTRMFGPQIASELSVSAAFERREAFDDYIRLLERAREVTLRNEEAFYLGLLRTPLADREATVVQWARNTRLQESVGQRLVQLAASLRGLRGKQ